MANPVITNLTVGKATYAPGERPTVTFTVTDADTRSITLNIEAVDSGGGSGKESVVIKIADGLVVSATDSDGGTWSVASKVGTTYTLQRDTAV